MDNKPKRIRVAAACQLCKQRRRKCSGIAPCELCTRCRVPCIFDPVVPEGKGSDRESYYDPQPVPAFESRKSSPDCADDLVLVQMYYRCMEEDLPLVTSDSLAAALQSAHSSSLPGALSAPEDAEPVISASARMHPQEAIMLRLFRGSDDVPFSNKRVRAIDDNLEPYTARLLFHAMAAAGGMFMHNIEAFSRHYNAATDMLGACFARPCASVVSALGILAMLTPLVSKQSVQSQFMLQLAESMISSGLVTVNPELRFAIRLLGQVWNAESVEADDSTITEADVVPEGEGAGATEAAAAAGVTKIGWIASRLTRGFYRGYDNLTTPEAIAKELRLVENMRQIAASPSPTVRFLRSIPLGAFAGQLHLLANANEEALHNFEQTLHKQELLVPEKRWCSILLRVHDACRKLSKQLGKKYDEEEASGIMSPAAVSYIALATRANHIAQEAAKLVVWPSQKENNNPHRSEGGGESRYASNLKDLASGDLAAPISPPIPGSAVELSNTPMPTQPLLPFQVYDSVVGADDALVSASELFGDSSSLAALLSAPEGAQFQDYGGLSGWKRGSIDIYDFPERHAKKARADSFVSFSAPFRPSSKLGGQA